MGGAEGVGSTWAMVPVRRQRQGLHGPVCRSVAWSYPVTPLAAFALSGAFDKLDVIHAINALNLGAACPAMPAHAKAPSGRRVDDRGLVHVWSPSHRKPNGLQRSLRCIIRAGDRGDPGGQAPGAEP